MGRFGDFSIEKDTSRSRVLIGDVPVPAGATDHGTLAGLDDYDHAWAVHKTSAGTINAVHTFNPSTPGAPFALGANAIGQLISGLNADKVDGYDGHAAVTIGNTGLSLIGQQISLALAAVSGLVISNGLMIDDSIAGAGLAISSKILSIAAADTSLTINADSIQVRRATNSGLEVATGLKLGTPTTITANSTNNVTGVSHNHAIALFEAINPTTLVPDMATAQGGSTYAARRDHAHGIATAAAGNILPDAAAAEGAGNTFARSDHVHGIITITPSGLGVGIASAEGGGQNFSRGDHTHAIDYSSDVGGTPAAKILASTPAGGLTLASLAVSGAVTIGQDLTIGANVFFVDQSQGSIGINCVPDPQFDMDVAGSARVQGWIVGRHALQIADAEAIWHFDGPQPYATDFTGTPLSHRALAPKTDTDTVYMRGKFGKALVMAEATTNLMRDPTGEEAALTYWQAINGATVSKDVLKPLFGANSVKVVADPAQSSSGIGQSTGYIGTVGSTFSVHAHVLFLAGAVNVSVWWRIWYTDATYDTFSGVTLTLDNDWQEVYFTETANGAKTVNYLQLMVRTANAGAATFWVDGFAAEIKDFPTPFGYGNMPGWAWDGTPYASTSTRTGAVLNYDNAPLKACETAGQGTIAFWVRKTVVDPGYTPAVTDYQQALNCNYGTGRGILIGFAYTTGGAHQFQVWGIGNTGGQPLVNADNFDGAGGSLHDGQWHHVGVTWDGTTVALYIDGESRDSEPQLATWEGFGVDEIDIGSWGANPIHNLNGWMDDVLIASRKLDSDEMRAIYESDAPVFAESSTFSFRTPTAAPIWADHEGLWMLDSNGNPVMGWSAVDGKSWGGLTLGMGDCLIGRYGSSLGGWQNWDRSDAKLSLGYADQTVWEFDAAGATLAGVLDIGLAGGIYQGTGTFASPTSGIKLRNDSGVGKLEAWNSGSLRAYFSASGLRLGLSLGTLDFYSGAALTTYEGSIYHDGSKMYLASGGSGDKVSIYLDDSADTIYFGVRDNPFSAMYRYDNGWAAPVWDFYGRISTNGLYYWTLGTYQSAGDAVSNGYVEVTIDGATYRLMTRA